MVKASFGNQDSGQEAAIFRIVNRETTGYAGLKQAELEFRRMVEPECISFEPDGAIPNNPYLPVLVYRGVFDGVNRDLSDQCESTFRNNGWSGCWRWGIFRYHHYHSNVHEALGVVSGTATLRIGGPSGKLIEVSAGDVLVLPAGTGHKCESSSPSFLVVGAYPADRGKFDLKQDLSPAPDFVKKAILETPVPDSDPLYGSEGPMVRIWGEARRG